MTADIPEWAMEKAQSTIEAYIDAAMPSIKQSAGWRDQDLYRAVAAALASVAKAERERAAGIAIRDVDWTRFGKGEVREAWENGHDDARDYRLGIVAGRSIAAAILSDGGRDG